MIFNFFFLIGFMVCCEFKFEEFLDGHYVLILIVNLDLANCNFFKE